MKSTWLASLCELLLVCAVSAQTLGLVNTGSYQSTRCAISEQGIVAYPGSAFSPAALYLGYPGQPIQMVLATNGPAPGSPPYTFGSLDGNLVCNGPNQIAFYDGLYSTNSGLFANFDGMVYRVAVKSNQVPTLPADILFAIGTDVLQDRLNTAFAMNSNGVFAFRAFFAGPGVGTSNNYATFRGHPTNLTIIARSGSPAPGFPANWVFAGRGSAAFYSGPIGINGSGRAVFPWAVACTTNSTLSTNCIWFDDAEGLRPVVRFDNRNPSAGTDAPDVPGARFRNLSDLNCLLNDAGEIAFYANAGSALTQGIWAGPTNNLRLIAAQWRTAPGIDGAQFSDLGYFARALLGNHGTVVFSATLSGTGVSYTNDLAGFIGSNTNNVRLLAREGSQAPGCPPGVYFKDVFNSGQGIGIFGDNRVAFYGQLAGPGVGYTNNVGLWATDPNGDVQLVFRTGETLFEIQPGDFRMVDMFNYFVGTGQDGRPACINRNGQLALEAHFQGLPDLAGVFILELNSGATTSGASCFSSCQFIPGLGFQLNLTVESNKAYRLQRNPGLDQANWTTLTNFTSTSTTFQYLDSTAATTQGVYRVVSP